MVSVGLKEDQDRRVFYQREKGSRILNDLYAGVPDSWDKILLDWQGRTEVEPKAGALRHDGNSRDPKVKGCLTNE